MKIVGDGDKLRSMEKEGRIVKELWS